MDNQFFTFELATQGKSVKYNGNSVDPQNNTNGDFTFKKIAAGFKFAPRWGGSVGLTPFSSVSYAFASKKEVPGTLTTSKYDGSGGINQVFFGNGYRITKNLSLGINAAFLFGSLTQTENIQDAFTQSVILSTKNTYYRKFNFTYGLQYFTAVTKKLDYNLGVTFSPENRLNGETSLRVTNNGTEVIRDEVLKTDHFTLPASFGVGMSVTKNKVLTFAADYKYQNWSASNYKVANGTLVNSNRYSVGVDYSKLKTANNFIYERYNLQAGLFYSNSYLQVNGKQINEYGVSVGGGLPVGGRINMNLSLQAGNRGTTQNGLIKESYIQATLNISYRDIWYTKGRKYE
jgi:hypothetical protein